MVIFLGDSYTWGQGLYSKKWIEEGKSIEYCNQHMPPNFHHESISHSDDQYRRTHHFPNIVAKNYDVSYYTKPKNGGSNSDISNILQEVGSICPIESIDLVVVQFTEFMRDLHYKMPENLNNYDIHKFIESECIEQIRKVYTSLKQNNIKNFVFFSWRDDIGKLLKLKYPKHFLPLYYNNEEYFCFEDMTKENQELMLIGSIGVNDHHLSHLGHQVIAESIIKKVDTMNIDFIRPK